VFTAHSLTQRSLSSAPTSAFDFLPALACCFSGVENHRMAGPKTLTGW
jgi:hypothetical protein